MTTTISSTRSMRPSSSSRLRSCPGPWPVLALALAMVSTTVTAADPWLEVGITGTWPEISASTNRNWPWGATMAGWAEVDDDRSPGLGLGAITVRLALDRFHLVGEWAQDGPFALGAGQPYGAPPLTDVNVAFRTEMHSADLRLERSWYPAARLELTPWLGLTRLAYEQSSRETNAVTGQVTSEVRTERRFVGWGPVVGGRAAWQLTASLSVGADLALRWAGGTREERLTTTVSAAELEPESESHHSEYDQTKMLVAADLGLRWQAWRQVSFEAGWRLRDWEVNVDGPFVRLLVGF